MTEYPPRADARDAPEVDHHQFAARPERGVDAAQHILWILEVMIGVADEHQIDAVRWQLHAVLIIDNADDVVQAMVPGTLHAGVDEVACDIDRIDQAARPDFAGHQGGKEAGARADIGDAVARLQAQMTDDVDAAVPHLATVALEHAAPLGDVGIFIMAINAGIDILLGDQRCRHERQGQEPEQGAPHVQFSACGNGLMVANDLRRDMQACRYNL